jgi:transcriptional regulator with PAS, ATPase and Fis domain
MELYAAPSGDEPRFFMAHGFAREELAAVRRAISTGIVREALATGRTISTASAVDDPRFREHGSVQERRIQAVLCAPIGDPSVGVVYLEGRASPGPFPEEDRAHAELFARHVAPLADRLLAREEASRSTDHTAPWRARLAVDRVAGTSRALAEAFRLMGVAAQAALPALFTGESGTGKSTFAHALHDSSPRRAGPFVEVNCAAIPETLFESELFGAERGAHSTATRRIDGKIDAAQGGTLFLDEVGELPLAVQSKLLLFLQSKKYYRLGSAQPITADVRVVAATNADPEELVRQKRLREDLYYRLNVLEIHVAPLRERREDIVPIAASIVDRLGMGGSPPTLTRAARAALTEAEWPGNVRQLENALQRGWAIADSEGSPRIEAWHLFPERAARAAGTGGGGLDGEAQADAATDGDTYEDATRRFQRDFLAGALERYGWNVSETARRIGLARSHVNDLIRAHGLTRVKK